MSIASRNIIKNKSRKVLLKPILYPLAYCHTDYVHIFFLKELKKIYYIISYQNEH